MAPPYYPLYVFYILEFLISNLEIYSKNKEPP